jgi:uncharacterized protein
MPSAPVAGLRQRIAIIGSGIAGNSAAWALSRVHDVTLFEADDRLGGHAHTIDVDLGGKSTPVDTGFIVYNEHNYPNLIALFATLEVPTEASNMSFAVSLQGGKLEYRSDASVNALFARRRNALSPRFWRMLLDIKRFYGQALDWPQRYDLSRMTFGELLAAEGVTPGFIADHIVPMAACIWSASTNQIMAFPAETFLRFFDNHGLFRLNDRPRWRTVTGGSRSYVTRIMADMTAKRHQATPIVRVERLAAGGVAVHPQGQSAQIFDQVVLATHADQALALLADPTQAEQQTLAAFRYSVNDAVVHRDRRLMPRRKKAWASWNYVAAGAIDADREVPITYWMNNLQNLDPRHPLFVSLNPCQDIAGNQIERQMTYTHPIFDAAAIAAQPGLQSIQGHDRLWFCGSYFGYGFHEDACASGLAVAAELGAAPAWYAGTGRQLLRAAE